MKLRNKKTGEIIDSACIGVFKHQSSGDCERVDTEARSLSKFLEQWEDYKPAEPLIKDEKIRKAVRVWAELYDGSAIRAHIGEDYAALFKDEVNGYSSSVEIDLPPEVFNELIDAHYYTIAELCGEEE